MTSLRRKLQRKLDGIFTVVARTRFWGYRTGRRTVANIGDLTVVRFVKALRFTFLPFFRFAESRPFPFLGISPWSQAVNSSLPLYLSDIFISRIWTSIPAHPFHSCPSFVASLALTLAVTAKRSS